MNIGRESKKEKQRVIKIEISNKKKLFKAKK